MNFIKRVLVKFLRVTGLYDSCKYYACLTGLRPFRINFLVLSVGQACNYKCRDCGNFAPYAPSQFMRYKLEDIISWLRRIIMSVDSIRKLQIQGGEPFLYSDLGELLKFLRNNTEVGGGGGKITDIVIATNGSIIPNDTLLEIIKTFNIRIRISDYNVTPEKTKKLIAVLQERGINYSVYEFAGKSGEWFNTGEVDLKNYPHTDETTARKRYKSCAFKGCLTLERGQLARCSRGNDAPVIQGFNESQRDYIKLSDFSDNKELRKALMKYCMFPSFMEACKYCNGTDRNNMVEAAIQL